MQKSPTKQACRVSSLYENNDLIQKDEVIQFLEKNYLVSIFHQKNSQKQIFQKIQKRSFLKLSIMYLSTFSNSCIICFYILPLGVEFTPFLWNA